MSCDIASLNCSTAIVQHALETQTETQTSRLIKVGRLIRFHDRHVHDHAALLIEFAVGKKARRKR